jgi:hypothetical protein
VFMMTVQLDDLQVVLVRTLHAWSGIGQMVLHQHIDADHDIIGIGAHRQLVLAAAAPHTCRSQTLNSYLEIHLSYETLVELACEVYAMLSQLATAQLRQLRCSCQLCHSLFPIPPHKGMHSRVQRFQAVASCRRGVCHLQGQCSHTHTLWLVQLAWHSCLHSMPALIYKAHHAC